MKRQSMQQFIKNNSTGENKDKLLKYYKEACHVDYMENQDYHKKYYQEHKDKYKEYRKKYYQEHKDKYKEYSKRYREKRKEEINKRGKDKNNK